MNIFSGVKADPNSNQPLRPASALAEFKAFRIAKLIPTDKQIAGSPVAEMIKHNCDQYMNNIANHNAVTNLLIVKNRLRDLGNSLKI